MIITRFISHILLGFVVGTIGVNNHWSIWMTMGVCLIFSLVLSALFELVSQND